MRLKLSDLGSRKDTLFFCMTQEQTLVFLKKIEEQDRILLGIGTGVGGRWRHWVCCDEINSITLPHKNLLSMEELTLTTPALLFSAVSLILLAYTNRFLSYAQLVRTLKDQHLQNPSKITMGQIVNLRRRLNLTRMMQILGVSSLFFCVVTMFLLYVGLELLSAWVFGVALLLLIGSLGVSIWEIQISVRALDLHLRDMEK